MKLVKILIVLAIVFVIGGFVLPSNYSVSRSILINGDKGLIHEYVGNLDKWPEWTPWEKADTSIIITPGDASSGMGASQSWTGNSSSGSLVFTETNEDGIKYDITFDNNDKAKAEIRYRELGGMTEVTWTMKGSMDNTLILGPYIAMSMDILTGRMFQQGLEDLKKVIEGQNY